MSHLYFYTFEHLQVDQALYTRKLESEMQVWHLKRGMLHSPHKAERDAAAKLNTNFLTVHSQILKKQKMDIQHLLAPIKISTVKNYLKRLQELKKQAFAGIVSTDCD